MPKGGSVPVLPPLEPGLPCVTDGEAPVGPGGKATPQECISGSAAPGPAEVASVLAMCTGKCSSVVGAALWPFALLCIVANILLAFPNWDAQYVHDWGKHLTPEIFYLGGLVGGGIMVLVPAVHIQATGRRGCCGNRCGMFISVLLAGVGVVGAAYALCVSMLGLVHGPLCRVRLQNGALSDWKRPFLIGRNVSQDSYLFAPEVWDDCEDPPGVTRFNVILFSLIASASVVELALCLIQVFNGLFGFLCGTCNEKKVAPKTYN